MGIFNRMWSCCHKVLPLTYDNALSYYETLCKIVNNHNKVVNTVNDLVDDVEYLNEQIKDIGSTGGVKEVYKYFYHSGKLFNTYNEWSFQNEVAPNVAFENAISDDKFVYIVDREGDGSEKDYLPYYVYEGETIQFRCVQGSTNARILLDRNTVVYHAGEQVLEEVDNKIKYIIGAGNDYNYPTTKAVVEYVAEHGGDGGKGYTLLYINRNWVVSKSNVDFESDANVVGAYELRQRTLDGEYIVIVSVDTTGGMVYTFSGYDEGEPVYTGNDNYGDYNYLRVTSAVIQRTGKKVQYADNMVNEITGDGSVYQYPSTSAVVGYVASHGGGGGGTGNYNDLVNKPKIGGVTLEGDKSHYAMNVEPNIGKSAVTINFAPENMLVNDEGSTRKLSWSNFIGLLHGIFGTLIDDIEDPAPNDYFTANTVKRHFQSYNLSSAIGDTPSTYKYPSEKAVADYVASHGGGGGGTGNYNELINKPKINGVVIEGDKTQYELNVEQNIGRSMIYTTEEPEYVVLHDEGSPRRMSFANFVNVLRRYFGTITDDWGDPPTNSYLYAQTVLDNFVNYSKVSSSISSTPSTYQIPTEKAVADYVATHGGGGTGGNVTVLYVNDDNVFSKSPTDFTGSNVVSYADIRTRTINNEVIVIYPYSGNKYGGKAYVFAGYDEGDVVYSCFYYGTHYSYYISATGCSKHVSVVEDREYRVSTINGAGSLFEYPNTKAVVDYVAEQLGVVENGTY